MTPEERVDKLNLENQQRSNVIKSIRDAERLARIDEHSIVCDDCEADGTCFRRRLLEKL